MKTTRCLSWLVVVITVAFMFETERAAGDDSSYGSDLIQVSFDHLIPTFTTVTPQFHRLIPTAWPLTDPGIAHLPITQDLVHPLDYPLWVSTTGTSGTSYTYQGSKNVQISPNRPTLPRPGIKTP